MIVSMDALFGLCRKKAAGKSVNPPLNDGLLFENQREVKEFIESYRTSAGCNIEKVHYTCIHT